MTLLYGVLFVSLSVGVAYGIYRYLQYKNPSVVCPICGAPCFGLCAVKDIKGMIWQGCPACLGRLLSATFLNPTSLAEALLGTKNRVRKVQELGPAAKEEPSNAGHSD